MDSTHCRPRSLLTRSTTPDIALEPSRPLSVHPGLAGGAGVGVALGESRSYSGAPQLRALDREKRSRLEAIKWMFSTHFAAHPRREQRRVGAMLLLR